MAISQYAMAIITLVALTISGLCWVSLIYLLISRFFINRSDYFGLVVKADFKPQIIDLAPNWQDQLSRLFRLTFRHWSITRTALSEVHPQIDSWIPIWVAYQKKCFYSRPILVYKGPTGLFYKNYETKRTLLRRIRYTFKQNNASRIYLAHPEDQVVRDLKNNALYKLILHKLPQSEWFEQNLYPLFDYLASPEGKKITNLSRVSYADMISRVEEHACKSLKSELKEYRLKSKPEKIVKFNGIEYGLFKLTTMQDFQIEGNLQRHCIGNSTSYYNSSVSGKHAYYSVREPGKIRGVLTLSLTLDEECEECEGLNRFSCTEAQSFANGFTNNSHNAYLAWEVCSAMGWDFNLPDYKLPDGFVGKNS
jgi:hypothetical protein